MSTTYKQFLSFQQTIPFDLQIIYDTFFNKKHNKIKQRMSSVCYYKKQSKII